MITKNTAQEIAFVPFNPFDSAAAIRSDYVSVG